MYTNNDLYSKTDAAKVNGTTKQKKQGLDATESELDNTDIQVEQLEVMSAENFDWKRDTSSKSAKFDSKRNTSLKLESSNTRAETQQEIEIEDDVVTTMAMTRCDDTTAYLDKKMEAQTGREI